MADKKPRKKAIDPKTGKHPGGRPTKYQPGYPQKVYKMALLNLKDTEIAGLLDISEKCLNEWKNKYPKFEQSLKNGREIADSKVGQRLFERAMGYSHKAVKIFCDVKTGSREVIEYIEHYPPDPTSMIFWLKNRHPERWRDKREHTGEGGGAIKVEVLSFGNNPNPK
jgi:hypothetical protein